MKKTIMVLKNGTVIETRSKADIYHNIYTIDLLIYNEIERWDFEDFIDQLSYNASKQFIKFGIDYLLGGENQYIDMVDMEIRFAQQHAGKKAYCPYGSWMVTLYKANPNYRFMLEIQRFKRVERGENVDDWDAAIEKERRIARLKRLGKWKNRKKKDFDLIDFIVNN